MKKVVLSLFIVALMFSTISFAAYPEGTEDIQEGLEVYSEGETPVVEDNEGESEDFGYTDDATEIDVEDSVVEDDKYVCQEEVEINEVVNGNLFVIAKKVKLTDASILGNLYAMAETIEIEDSTVSSSMFLMGKDIKFSGTTTDIYAIGEKIDLAESSNVWRNVKAMGETLSLNGSIGRDVYAMVANLAVGDGAIVEGNLNYSSEKEVTIPESAQVGNVNFSVVEKKEVEKEDVAKVAIASQVWSILSFVFKVLIIALILINLVKRFSTIKRDEKISNDYLRDFGKGAMLLVLTPIIALAFFISILGIGLGCLLILLYIATLYVATSVFIVDCAYRIAEMKKIEGKGKLIGLSLLLAIIIWVIDLVPVLGGLVTFIIFVIGLGIIVDLLFNKNKKSGEIEVVNEK